jgi:DNA-binding NtrC family response regulator
MAARLPANDSDHTHTLTTGMAEPSHDRAWILRVIDGPDRGKSVALGDVSVVVGSGTTVDLALTDPGVSRRHLEVAVVPGGVRVVDLGSKNGTQLAGAKLSVAVVSVGAEIRLGKSILRLDDADAEDEAVESDRLGPLSAQSTAMKRVFGALARVAVTDVPVLLLGEEGTGKGTLARALHAASSRAGKKFLAVDVGELQDAEATAVLFGDGDKPGAFESAHGGTLLLHDIGAAPFDLQLPLARAIDEGVVVRAGDPRGRRVSVRTVATNEKSLDGEVKAGRVRKELRDALAAVVLEVPPLRERSADLPELARTLLAELGSTAPLGDDDRARLAGHRWPGNLRELKTVLARAVANAAGGPVRVVIDAPAAAASLRDQRSEHERAMLVDLLQKHGGNVSAAARAASIDRRHFHRLLKKHGLRGG